MRIFGKNLDEQIAVVAEIGINHEGGVDVAADLIREAAYAGADAVKIQSYTPERYASASDPARLQRVRSFALTLEEHHQLVKVAKSCNIPFMSTPLTEDWVAKLDPLVEAIKIASGDLTFEPVMRAAARTSKNVFVSTGLGTIEEIDQAVSWLIDEMGSEQFKERVVLFQCVSAYPTPVEEAGVAIVPFLRDRYGCVVGYSNHVLEPEACYAAAALGAQIVEVHFTDRKEGREFRDHALSFEAKELRALIKSLNLIKKSIGNGQKMRMPSEIGNLNALRKGIVAARNLKKGQVLSEADLMFARPATQFRADELNNILGQRLDVAVNQGELIPRSAIATPNAKGN